MRGINKVIISGNVSEEVHFASGPRDSFLCTFYVASDRHAQGAVSTTWVKVNVYVDGLVKLCRTRLRKGTYVMVEGELTSRGEVKARELIFLQEGRRSENAEASK
jgi:single-stranded DNA-binding protein